MKTIMFNSEKGGTGKTTLSTLSAALLAAQGYKVLLVDFDPQAHATISFGLPKSPGVYEAVARKNVPIMERVIQPEDFRFCPPGITPKGELHILPGNDETFSIPNQAREVDELTQKLEDAADEIPFDVCIIDTAPSAGLLLTFAYHASDYVVIPSKMEYLSMDGIEGTVNASRKWNVELLGIVPNMFKAGTNLHEFHYNNLRNHAVQQGWPIWEPIADRIEWAEASTFQSMIYALSGQASKARIEAIQFANRLTAAVLQNG